MQSVIDPLDNRHEVAHTEMYYLQRIEELSPYLLKKHCNLATFAIAT